MRSQSNYRDSFVDPLGDLPEHWEVKALKHSVLRTDVKIEPEEAGQLGYIGLERVASWTGQLLPLDLDLAPESAANAFERGDVLFGKLRPYLAKAWCADFDGVCSTEFLVLKPRNYGSSFLLYLVMTDGFISHVDSSTYGAKMPRASWDFIGDSPLPVPPLDEQRDIAAFLDRETERIDSLIAKKRLLIERLQEYRTAMITRTVTRGLPPQAARAAGLDPSPRLKPSGVEWLGDIPEHWSVGQLKRWFKIVNGGTPKSSDDRFWDGEIIWVTPDDLGRNQAKRIGEGARKLTIEGLESCSARLCPERSIALSTRAPIGHVAITSTPSATNQGCRTLVPGSEIDSEFAYYFILAGKPTLEAHGQGSTFMELGQSDLGRTRFPKPPLDEQRALVSFLTRETEKSDTLVSLAEAAIGRLQEYRIAIITAAVTGKIDVRQTASSDRDSAESQP